MEKQKWSELGVTNDEGNCIGTLGDIVANSPEMFDTATIENGKIESWPQYFLTGYDEEPDWDTPRCEVDWTGFEDAIQTARG